MLVTRGVTGMRFLGIEVERGEDEVERDEDEVHKDEVRGKRASINKEVKLEYIPLRGSTIYTRV